jgi:hypothetical protein
VWVVVNKRQTIAAERAKDRAKIARLVGRTIVKADPQAAWEDDGANSVWMHSWRLTLDDGTTVNFMTEEHPIGAEYGTDICISDKRTP